MKQSVSDIRIPATLTFSKDAENAPEHQESFRSLLANDAGYRSMLAIKAKVEPLKRLAAHLQIDTKEISLTLQEFIERRIHRQRVDSGVQRTTRVSVPFVERHVNAPSPHQQVSSSEDLTSRIAATIDEKLPNYFQLSEHDWGSRPC